MRAPSRRTFLKTAPLAGLAIGLPIRGFPNVLRGAKPRLRVLGTHVTLQERIRLKAEQDLGIDIEFFPGGSAEVIHRATTDPRSFDIYEQWSNSLKVLWNAQTVQPIDIRRIDHWDEINNLTKTGRLTPEASLGQGDAPYKLLYVQEGNRLGSEPTRQISFLPYVHNTDSIGYDSRVIPAGIPYETESWGWLLDERYRGRVALVNEPTIGLFDAALAAQARGLVSFQDIGNMTREEVDALFQVLVSYRKRGHFRGVWSSVPRSVKLMAEEGVVVQSMFSPGVTTLRGMGIPCIYAAPREGYRAWHGVMCLSVESRGSAQEAAYAFMNWWLSGWPGAFIARQGYYIANPQRSRPLMSEAEWDYWYEGKAAREPLFGTDDLVVASPGELRTGGSYTRRFSRVAVWNSVMDTYEYSLLRWNEFLLSSMR